jgi:multidrug resistance efflux pump
LEKLQAEAIKNNPGMKVAEARLRLAQAKHDRARVNLLAQVTVAEVEAARSGHMVGMERYEREHQLWKQGSIPKEESATARLTFENLRSEFALKEAQLNRLLGRTGKLENEPKKKAAAPDRCVRRPARSAGCTSFRRALDAILVLTAKDSNESRKRGL